MRDVKCLTSSSLATVSLHCGIRLTKLDVVGLLKSSRTSRTKSGAEMGAMPGMMTLYPLVTHTDISDNFWMFSTIFLSYNIVRTVPFLTQQR